MKYLYFSGLAWAAWICIAGLMAGESYAAESAGSVDQDIYQPFKLVTGDVAVEIVPARAFTLNSIWYRDVHVGIRRGFYGFVFRSKDHHWVGTGHREGGREEVLTVQLTVDGQEREIPTDGSDIKGESASLVKTSRLKGLLLTSRMDFHPDRIEQSQDVSFASRTHIHVAYAFMHSWTPATRHWLARDTHDEIIKGAFTDEEARIPRASNLKWMAAYEPEGETVILTTFPTDLRPGEGPIRHAYRDASHYHKQYYQPFHNRTFAPGDTFAFQMTIHLFHAPVDEWVEQTKRLADASD